MAKGKGGAKKPQTPEVKKPMKVKGPKPDFTPKGMTIVQAISILIGAGVHINKKKKIMVFTRGFTRVTSKVVKAGGVLDALGHFEPVEGKPAWVPDWKTKWVDFDLETYKKRKAKQDRRKEMIKAQKAVAITTEVK